RERPLPPGAQRRAARRARRCQLWRPLPRALDAGIVRELFLADRRARRAALQVLGELRGAVAGFCPDQQPRLFAVHGCSCPAAASGAEGRPQMTRSLLRARNRRVSTAVEDSASSCAISSVENPPRTC